MALPYYDKLFNKLDTIPVVLYCVVFVVGIKSFYGEILKNLG